MSEEKKGIPDEFPTPEPEEVSGDGAETPEVSDDQLLALVNGEATFQDFFSLSDDVLLAWANQGYLFYKQGKYEESEVIFKGLVTLNPKIAYYHTALGSLYEAQEEYDKALEEFNAALEIDNDDICALINRGEISLRKGQVLEAAEDFKKGIELDDANMEKQKEAGEPPTPDPAAQRARALSVVTYEVLKEIEEKVKEAQAKGDLPPS